MTTICEQTLLQLIDMSHELGKPEHDLAMLGEGNTSALLEDGTFYVKASGSMLSTIDINGFALLNRAAAEAKLDEDLRTDADILAALMSVAADTSGKRPSVESMMHAFLLGLPDVSFVGHTHPSSVCGLLCSTRAEELVNMCLFPDQIVCCGPAPVYVPYTDPGLSLARLVRDRVNAWMDVHQMTPKAVMLQNHGLFALGKTPQQVISCTLMWSKTARVFIGALACGGVTALTSEHVERIYTRPDEKFREKMIEGK